MQAQFLNTFALPSTQQLKFLLMYWSAFRNTPPGLLHVIKTSLEAQATLSVPWSGAYIHQYVYVSHIMYLLQHILR